MTTGKRIIIIDEAVLERIDEVRGEMGRPEFVALCVETALQDLDSGEEEISDAGEEYALLKGATRYLSNEINAVKEHLRGPTAPREAPARMEQVSHHPMGLEVGRNGQGEAITAAAESPLALNQWWLLAIVLFGFGDTLTSLMVFARGGTEANPLMGLLLPLVGNNLWGFVVIKTLAVVALLYLSYKQVKSKAWLIPAAASAVGGYLVLNNLVQFFKLS